MTYINYSNVWLQTHFMSLTDNTCELKTGTNVKKVSSKIPENSVS